MLPRVDLIRTQESDWALLATNDVISNHLKRFDQWGQNELTMARMALAQQVQIQQVQAVQVQLTRWPAARNKPRDILGKPELRLVVYTDPER